MDIETTSDAADINGVIGGGQIGYNYQLNPNYVAGVEADIQGSGEQGSDTVLVCHGPAGPAPGIACDTTNIFDHYTEKLEWFGTVRGRLGYLVNPNVLTYATAVSPMAG